jgi:Zn-dependent peptidase ImmA (M78 family)
MIEQLGVGFLPYHVIAKRADDFLRQYNPLNDIPVPIEEIAEFSLNLEIIPIPNLQKNFEVEGFISSDLKCIYVDQFSLSERPTRYRFTLAHEIGHIFLHRQIFQKVNIVSLESWKKFVEEVDKQEYNRMEFQGYAFGGLALVPSNELENGVRGNLKELAPYINACKETEIARDDYVSYAVDLLASLIAPTFDVSTEVVEKRIRYEKLERLIP